jgi:hypothetical protein
MPDPGAARQRSIVHATPERKSATPPPVPHLSLNRNYPEMDRVVEGNTRRPRQPPEISWTFTARIDPGEYPAYCRSATVYRDGQFKRWVCAVQFDVLDASLTRVIARLTWYINLGARDKPHAGRRGNYWSAWAKANGGQPKRNDRLSPSVFKHRHARVTVQDTCKTHRQKAISSDESYSVIRDVVELQTGGSPQ